jgi:hypothetical protein
MDIYFALLGAIRTRGKPVSGQYSPVIFGRITSYLRQDEKKFFIMELFPALYEGVLSAASMNRRGGNDVRPDMNGRIGEEAVCRISSYLPRTSCLCSPASPILFLSVL